MNDLRDKVAKTPSAERTNRRKISRKGAKKERDESLGFNFYTPVSFATLRLCVRFGFFKL